MGWAADLPIEEFRTRTVKWCVPHADTGIFLLYAVAGGLPFRSLANSSVTISKRLNNSL
jgi:hypothetical protein